MKAGKFFTRGDKVTLERADIQQMHDALIQKGFRVVQGACEILGFDPLYVANEGRFIAFVSARQAELALSLMRSDALGASSCRIGVVQADQTGMVTLRSQIGATRILDMLSGDQLPRICDSVLAGSKSFAVEALAPSSVPISRSRCIRFAHFYERIRHMRAKSNPTQSAEVEVRTHRKSRRIA